MKCHKLFSQTLRNITNITKQVNQKQINILHLSFHRVTVVYVFCSLKKGVIPKIGILCFVKTKQQQQKRKKERKKEKKKKKKRKEKKKEKKTKQKKERKKEKKRKKRKEKKERKKRRKKEREKKEEEEKKTFFLRLYVFGSLER